ncbi:hypothetical protein [Aneurinibacillus sp. Ricciae_BoGa-3]|uniref:hypothetical protein n=1 Tax=Aneurinibacillus sp. Ricciae_BoGa-3 TaxID=3022697 RepID=UPI002FEE02D5
MHRTASSGYRFLILILVVIVAGASQGLLLPLLTILLEKSGVSSGTNGLNAAALYIGTFLAMLWIEKPVRRLGYKRIIGAGITRRAVSRQSSLQLFSSCFCWRVGLHFTN